MTDRTKPAAHESPQELWAREADENVRYGKGYHWVESPIVMAYINERMTGNPELDWVGYIYHKFLSSRNAQDTRVLSLGCGGGSLERQLSSLGFRGQIEACDFSDGAIEHARELAAQEKRFNIRYFVCNLNHAEFSANTYDFVIAGSSLHHVANLEHLLDQLRGALVENGKLILNEYVGPFKLQLTAKQTKIIDELLHILPRKYRKRASAPDEFRDGYLGPGTVREMDAADPTEAVRSDEIVPLIQARFFIHEQKQFGGTLLRILLHDIVGNFDIRDESDVGFLNLLIYIEKTLITEKVLDSDFVLMVADKISGASQETTEAGYPIDLATELKARDTRILNLQEELRQMHIYADCLESRLSGTASSMFSVGRADSELAPELVQRFRYWKEHRLPVGSLRRRFYDRVVAMVRKRVTKNHRAS